MAWAYDVAGNIAVTVVLDHRSGVQCSWQQVWHRSADSWTLLSASRQLHDHTAPVDRGSDQPPALLTAGTSSTMNRFGHGSGRYICSASFRATGPMRAVRISTGTLHRETREVPVPWHGHVILVWPTRARISRIHPRMGISVGASRRLPWIRGVTDQHGLVPPRSK